jgi:hypothetical protein
VEEPTGENIRSFLESQMTVLFSDPSLPQKKAVGVTVFQ